MSLTGNDLKDLSAGLERSIQKAADLMEEFGHKHQQLEVKSRNSLVTEVDKALENLLVESLRTLLPEAGFLTEEETVSFTEKPFLWIIDPLDGTTNFIHGIPAYTISVALSHKGNLLLGGILELNSGEYFSAIHKQGAFLNKNRIGVSDERQLQDSLIATGFPYYDFEHLDEYLSMFRELMGKTRGIRRIGSAALDLTYVACGRFNGFFEYSLHPWDVAAGSLIVKEAGGVVSDFSGGDNFLFGGQILASSKGIYQQMLEMSQRHFA